MFDLQVISSRGQDQIEEREFKKIVGSQVREAKLNKKMSDQIEKFFSFERQKRVKLKKGAMILFGKEKLSYIDEKRLKNF